MLGNEDTREKVDRMEIGERVDSDHYCVAERGTEGE